MKPVTCLLPSACALAVLSLAACGGGGSPATPSGTATISSVSSGAITAFGSVFVNGHEFKTDNATVVDDDTLARTTSTAGLEVGMAVDVKPAMNTSGGPEAAEIHLHPLARGIVDASNTTANTLTVMGQTVQLTASTTFSDHRACLVATPTPCAAVTGQSGLASTSGSGGTATAGSYVTVDGYLYASGPAPAGANIVATLVSVRDLPTTAIGANYKAEGVVTALAGSTATIGGLAVDLSGATCFAAETATPCASAFNVGQVVSVFAATEPALPVSTFSATTALLRDKLVVQTAGASIELEGRVSSVTASPASFVIRGVTIDASALSGTTLPAVGDEVRVLGVVASNGTSVTASALTLEHAARSATYGLEGDVGSVAAGPTADTYVLTLLGQSVTVNAMTRLADRSLRDGDRGDSASNPFNITTFPSYLKASSSQHLLVRTAADAGGNLTALSVTIAPASTVAGIAGVVDATPVPVNSSTRGTPSTFSIHGLAVSADPAAIVKRGGEHSPLSSATVAAGDFVLVRGSLASTGLVVAAPVGPPDRFAINIVIDTGVPSSEDHDGF
ncbi:MAG: hypothetical protein KGL99_11860 [Burkholderiales bacterium]|nr:hypothetical protein [Burkholderiales bacterium]MDE2627839.1 hypothetical protein [Burkholderiales bacterium]